jgi:hypothetical protein
MQGSLETLTIDELKATIRDCVEELCKRCVDEPPPLIELTKFCQYCGSHHGKMSGGFGKCQKCVVARYCDEACQLADWPVHKLICAQKHDEDDEEQCDDEERYKDDDQQHIPEQDDALPEIDLFG